MGTINNSFTEQGTPLSNVRDLTIATSHPLHSWGRRSCGLSLTGLDLVLAGLGLAGLGLGNQSRGNHIDVDRVCG